jgi:dTDP-4-amino-4,6-dideoxygalactose transaminase
MAKIPIVDLNAQYQTIRDELRRAVDGVLESQRFILGTEVGRFEKEAAAYLACREAIGVASGSDALLLSLMALGIGPGDGVLVSTFTFFATASAVARLGATPVFVDIGPESYLIGNDRIEAAVKERCRIDGEGLVEKKSGARIRAILPVHLFGEVCAMSDLMPLAAKYRLSVVEDVAQAFGAGAVLAGTAKAAGTIGDLGCFSFFPTKNLGGIGDGGLIATDQAELAEKVRMLRVHGESSKYTHQLIGLNSRLDAIQAAVLSVKLRYLDRWCTERIERARRYRDLFVATGLVGKDIVRLPAGENGPSHVFNYYVIRARRRDQLRVFLATQDIQAEVYYPIPLHLQPCFAYLGYRAGDLPNAERAAAEVLALPLYPELTADQQQTVVQKIAEFYRK